jgi:hypothetical protein
MRPSWLTPTLVTTGFLVACSEQPTGPRPLPGTPPAFAILDGAHGGSPQFYFLPPMVPAPSYSGTFDGSQSPVVQICVLAGNTCGAIITSFSGSAVKVDLDAQAYGVNWKTKGAGLDPTKTYRIEVLIGTRVLGYADVVVLSNGSQIKTVDKSQFVATINGGVLPIRFRIETAPPPPSGGWQNGDLITWTQLPWGDPTYSAGSLLNDQYDFVYGWTGGLLEVGIHGTAGYSILFTSASAILAYLPGQGALGSLNADLVDPTSSASGAFGGEVTALQLNVDFTDAGFLLGASPVRFGDVTLCGFSTPAAANGMTVRSLLSVANVALGGGSTSLTITELFQIAKQLNASFEQGSPSQFAQDHLVDGACPGGWQNGT